MKKTPGFTLTQGPSIKRDLVVLYDDFSEFDAYCAFFCDAVAALSKDQDDFLDRATAQGIRLFGDWLKESSKELKEELKEAWQESSAR